MICKMKCRRYCYEPLSMIEGYEEAVSSSERWDCHHRVETIMNCGRKELKAKGCYWHRPAHDLIFLPHEEHTRIHSLRRYLSDSAKEKLRRVSIGRRLSDTTKEKLREASLGNKNWLGKNHSEKAKEKLRQANIGKNNPAYGTHWWNNGEKCVRTRKCPGVGWRRGRLRTEE